MVVNATVNKDSSIHFGAISKAMKIVKKKSRQLRISGDLLTSSVSSILSFCLKKEITLNK